MNFQQHKLRSLNRAAHLEWELLGGFYLGLIPHRVSSGDTSPVRSSQHTSALSLSLFPIAVPTSWVVLRLGAKLNPQNGPV